MHLLLNPVQVYILETVPSGGKFKKFVVAKML